MTAMVAILGRQRYVSRSIRLMQASGGGNDDGMPPSISLRVDRLEKDVAEIKGDVKTLSGDVRTLTGEVKTISADLKALTGEVRILSGEVKTLSGDMAKAWAEIAEVKGRVSLMPSSFQIQTWFVGVSIAMVGMVFAIARLAK